MDDEQTRHGRILRHRIARLRQALGELDYALSGIPLERRRALLLEMMPAQLAAQLAKHAPPVAFGWQTIDVRNGEPVRLQRRDHDGYAAATIKRQSQGKRARPRWAAFVGAELVSPPSVDANGDAMPIDWSTTEDAQAACDDLLRSKGWVLIDE